MEREPGLERRKVVMDWKRGEGSAEERLHKVAETAGVASLGEDVTWCRRMENVSRRTKKAKDGLLRCLLTITAISI